MLPRAAVEAASRQPGVAGAITSRLASHPGYFRETLPWTEAHDELFAAVGRRDERAVERLLAAGGFNPAAVFSRPRTTADGSYELASTGVEELLAACDDEAAVRMLDLLLRRGLNIWQARLFCINDGMGVCGFTYMSSQIRHVLLRTALDYPSSWQMLAKEQMVLQGRNEPVVVDSSILSYAVLRRARGAFHAVLMALRRVNAEALDLLAAFLARLHHRREQMLGQEWPEVAAPVQAADTGAASLTTPAACPP